MTVLQRFSKNTVGRDFVVGDLHGCLPLLHSLLDQAGFDRTTDRLFSVGDLVDRGEDSPGVVQLIREPWFAAVMGNHDYFVHTHWTVDPAIHLMNGGAWWYSTATAEQQDCIDLVGTLPYAIEVETDEGNIGLVHAEVPDDDWTVWERFDPSNEMMGHYAMWGRAIIRGKVPWFEGVANITRVYVGHSVVKEVTDIHNVRYIDTGACYGKKLTMECIQGSDLGERWEVSNEVATY